MRSKPRAGRYAGRMAGLTLGLALFTATALSRPAMGASGDARVAVEGFAFTPVTVTIPAGASVVWAVRKDPEQHTVTPTTPGSFDGSGPLFDGDDYTVRFDTPGRYDYVCSFHPFMTGSVVVEPAATTAPTATATPIATTGPTATAMPIATASPRATTAPILTPSGSVPSGSIRPSDPAGDRTPGPPTFAVVLILVALVGAVGAALLLRGRHAR